MPLYDYKCDNCGLFEEWRSLAQLNEPMLCPTCQATAKRVFSPPMLLTGNLRSSRQERREPELIKRDREPKSPKNQVAKGRPWMIGH